MKTVIFLKNVVFLDVAPCRSCVNRRSAEISVHTRSSRRHIPEDGILHSHRRENLISYILIFLITAVRTWASRNSHTVGDLCKCSSVMFMIVCVCGNLDDGPGLEHENMRFFSGLNGCFFRRGMFFL
jgi:hypothetical protein